MRDKELTHSIIGASMKVHNTIGRGFREVIYQRALAIELKKIGLECQMEMVMDICYDGNKIGSRRVDLISITQTINQI